MVSVRVLQESHERLNHELSIQGRYPSIFDGLSTDLTGVLLDVRVEYLRLEEHFGSLKGVVVAEIDHHDELSTIVGGFLGSHNSRAPLSQGVTDEGDRDTFNWLVHVQICQLL